MGGYWKSQRNLIYVAASVFFTLQMLFAVQKYVAKPTMISPGTSPFSSLYKPLQITACKLDQFNNTRAAGLAYNGKMYHLAGVSTNESVLTWTGLNENVTFEEAIHLMYSSTRDIVFSTGYFDSINGTISRRFQFPHGDCKVFEGKPASFMSIKLGPTTFSHILFISDPTAVSSFQLPYSLMSGDQITLKPPEYLDVNIQIKETTVYTDDGSCVDYPNNHHASYADCVDAEMRRWLLPTLGCMIPWMSGRDACTEQIKRLPKHQPLVNWIFDIFDESLGGIEYRSESCLPSCSLLSVHSRKTLSSIPIGNVSSIFLHFSKEIQVEKIVMAYDSTALLVEIGSSLGLWLGLSVVGIFDLVPLAAQKTKIWLRPA